MHNTCECSNQGHRLLVPTKPINSHPPLTSRISSSFLRMFCSSKWMVCTTDSSRRISVCDRSKRRQPSNPVSGSSRGYG